MLYPYNKILGATNKDDILYYGVQATRQYHYMLPLM